MKHRAVLLAVLGILVIPAGFVPARAAVGLGLPPHARVLAMHSIPGRPKDLVVAFATNQDFLAVVFQGTHGTRIIWKEGLPTTPSALKTPGPSGLFLTTLAVSGTMQELLALRLTAKGQVVSAVQGTSSGLLKAAEGFSAPGLILLARDRDMKHVGSVRYRVVRHYQWSGSSFALIKTTRVPDYASNKYPRPNGLVKTKVGNKLLIRLEVARTDAEKSTGLMNVKKLDPDAGMIFVWTAETHDSFWMQNTYIPLSIAFLSNLGTIQEIMDMAPLTTTLHTPKDPYLYAIEVNKGFFTKNGIGVGDRVKLDLRS